MQTPSLRNLFPQSPISKLWKFAILTLVFTLLLCEPPDYPSACSPRATFFKASILFKIATQDKSDFCGFKAQGSVASASNTTIAPSNLSYTITPIESNLIPGNTIAFPPTVSGTVTSWTISPTLPGGVSFDLKTGIITCAPPLGSPAFPLTSFTVTANNSGGIATAIVRFQILGSGENIWTVLNGLAGGVTKAGLNSLKYDSTCNCIYIGGTTNVNLDGQIIPSTGGNASGFLSRYDLNGNKIWTRVFGVAAATFTNVFGLVTDASGNIYLTGVKGPGNFQGCTGIAAATGYVVKFNSSGVFQWTSYSAPNQNHEYLGVVIDINGDVLAGGSTSAATPFDGMAHTSGTDQAAIIQKFNPLTGARISGVIVPGNSARVRPILSISPFGKIYENQS